MKSSATHNWRAAAATEWSGEATLSQRHEQREHLFAQQSAVGRSLVALTPGPRNLSASDLLRALATHRGDWLPLVIDGDIELEGGHRRWYLLPLDRARFARDAALAASERAALPDEILWRAFLRLTAPLRSVAALPLALQQVREALENDGVIRALLPWWPDDLPAEPAALSTALRRALSEEASLEVLRHPRSAASRFLALLIEGVHWQSEVQGIDTVRACLYAPQLVATPWRAWDTQRHPVLALHHALAAGDREFSANLLTRVRPQGGDDECFAGRSLAHHAAMGGLSDITGTSTLHIELDPRGFGDESPQHLAAAAGHGLPRQPGVSLRDICQHHPEDYGQHATQSTSLRPPLHLQEDPAVQPAGEASPSEEELQLSRLFAGRYRLLKLLGSGGFGSVFLAWDTQLKRRVALKCPNASALGGGGKYVMREIEAGLTVNDASTARFLYVCMDGERPGLVFEYLSGGDLASHLARWEEHPEERPDSESLCGIAIDTINALRALHRAGMVHRDLKPDNLMLEQRGERPHQVRLIDLGAAKFRRRQTTQIAGSFDYMAPDFFVNPQAASPATDVYSLGVVLWELLCGRLPYRAESWQQAAALHLREPLPAFRPLSPCPEPVANAVVNALSKEASERPTLDALRAAFMHWRYRLRHAAPDKRTILDEGGALEVTTLELDRSEAFQLLFVGEEAALRAQARHVRQGQQVHHFLAQQTLITVAAPLTSSEALPGAARAYARFLTRLFQSSFRQLAEELVCEASREEIAALLEYQLREETDLIIPFYQLLLARDGGLTPQAREWWQAVLNAPELRRVLSLRGPEVLPEALRPFITYQTRRLDALSTSPETHVQRPEHAALERAFSLARQPAGLEASLVELIRNEDRDGLVDALRRGALPNIPEDGRLPLHAAIEVRNADMIAVLRSAGATIERTPELWVEALYGGNEVVAAFEGCELRLPDHLFDQVLQALRSSRWSGFRATLDMLSPQLRAKLVMERLRDAAAAADDEGIRDALSSWELDAATLFDEMKLLRGGLSDRGCSRALRAAQGSGFATALLHHALERGDVDDALLALKHRADAQRSVGGLSSLARAWNREQWSLVPHLMNAGATRWEVDERAPKGLPRRRPPVLSPYLGSTDLRATRRRFRLDNDEEGQTIAGLINDILLADDVGSLHRLLDRLEVDDVVLPGGADLTMMAAAASPDCLRWLVDNKHTAKPDERSGTDTPLHIAAAHGNAANVGKLLSSGYSPLALSADGATALHYAAAGGYRRVCEQLLAAGAEVDATTPGGLSAVAQAERAEHSEVIALLRDHATPSTQGAQTHLNPTRQNSAPETS